MLSQQPSIFLALWTGSCRGEGKGSGGEGKDGVVLHVQPNRAHAQIKLPAACMARFPRGRALILIHCLRDGTPVLSYSLLKHDGLNKP